MMGIIVSIGEYHVDWARKRRKISRIEHRPFPLDLLTKTFILFYFLFHSIDTANLQVYGGFYNSAVTFKISAFLLLANTMLIMLTLSFSIFMMPATL